MRLFLFLLSTLVPGLLCQHYCGSNGFLTNGDDPTDSTWFCVRHYNVSKTWLDAEKYCKKIGAQMASIHSKDENINFLPLQKFPSFWLGGRDVKNSGAWSWDDGTTWDYSNWGAGEPNKYLPWDCLLVDPLTALWQAGPCNSKTAGVACATPFTFPNVNPPNTTCWDKYCFEMTDTGYDRDGAEKYCQSKGGHLASIHSAGDVQRLIAIANYNSEDNFWIGLTQTAPKKFVWSDGSPYNFDDFLRPSFPDYTDGECVELDTFTGKWINMGCTNTLSVGMCEIPITSF
ncbi:hypothetical protein QR680_014631 [Steinernema hermaphroditum]|uniref:C-type lectin domain-containing protein n=1 Tax=Steinernema hermaphroditum TaxID=289476 RepID=A0AA39IBU3_9BILA|nr:hypothetical protein QR680_014631 [Steinernema hermaphroditum]